METSSTTDRHPVDMPLDHHARSSAPGASYPSPMRAVGRSRDTPQTAHQQASADDPPDADPAQPVEQVIAAAQAVDELPATR